MFISATLWIKKSHHDREASRKLTNMHITVTPAASQIPLDLYPALYRAVPAFIEAHIPNTAPANPMYVHGLLSTALNKIKGAAKEAAAYVSCRYGR